MDVLKDLLNAHEELEKVQQKSAAFANAVHAIERRIANIDVEIAQFENYLESKKPVVRESLALTSLRTRRANLEKSLATLRARSTEIEGALRVAGENVERVEMLMRSALTEKDAEKRDCAVEK